MLHFSSTSAADQKTAGKEQIPGLFDNGVRLTGEQRFVDFTFPLHQQTVSTDLSACGKEQNVIQYDFLHRNFLRLPLPNDMGPGSSN